MNSKKKPNFLRRAWDRHSKLGKKRKKIQKWKKPTGRDNKMREKRRGYPATVSIGYSAAKTERNLVEGKKPILISNLNDLEKVREENIAIIASVGKKKKLEIMEQASKKKIKIYKINPEKFIKNNKKGEKK